MTRTFDAKRLIVASHNAGKVREIGDLLAPFGVDTVSAAELGLPEPVEDGQTFIENAEIKAIAAAVVAAEPALADDSGLVVPALGGAPGLFSARWAGPDKDFDMAMKKVMDELGDKDPAAYFICALSLAWPDGHVETFEGTVDGTLVWPPRGDKGFGYDPIFVPTGYDITFAEMDPVKKHAMSHRADAFNQMIEAVFANR